MEHPPENPNATISGISHINDDILQNILSKLPAQSFASAACVSRTWNAVSCRILSRPLLASAISLNASLPEAMEEVAGKVLSGPIRPHFAILCMCPSMSLDEAHRLITEKLGCKVPVVTCSSAGIIGRDALTNQFSEVMFPYVVVDDDPVETVDYVGISLTVGYVPGMKVDAIPLSQPVEGASIDKFVIDIRDYADAVSGYMSPEAIIMFGDSQGDLKPVLEKLDYALSDKTVIAGNESCQFRYLSMDHSSATSARQRVQGQSFGAVALVFARDKTKLNGSGKIEFHFDVASGVCAVGPTYRVVSAKMRSHELTTWLTAKREGENEILDGQQLLNDMDVEMGDPISNFDLYIGVAKKRKYSIGTEKVKPVMSLAYHPVQDGDEQYLYVRGLDIKTGDSFRFYVPDPKSALSLSVSVSENFGKLGHKEVIGGFVFACCGRGATFFSRSNVDSSPILDNFPCIPVAGMFCGAEIGRGHPTLVQSVARSSLHVYSSIYLLMSYNTPSNA